MKSILRSLGVVVAEKVRVLRLSVSQDYLLTACLILFGTVLFSTYFAFQIHVTQSAALKQRLTQEAHLVNSQLTNVFDNIARITEDKGRKIAMTGGIDLEQIRLQFSRKFSFQSDITAADKPFMWPHFGWVNADYQVVVRSDMGILKNPYPIARQAYLYQARKLPWKLHLSPILYDEGLEEYVILGAMGITDQNEQPIGMVTTQFELDQLLAMLSQVVGAEQAHFMILDNSNQALAIDQQRWAGQKPLVDELAPATGSLAKPLSFEDYHYTTYDRLKHYPLTVLTGYDPLLIEQQTWAMIGKRVLEILGAATFFLIIMVWFYRRIIRAVVHLVKVAENIATGKSSPNDLEQQHIHYAPQLQALKDALLSTEQHIRNKEEALENERSALHALKNSNELLEKAKHELEAEKMVSRRSKELGEAFFSKIRHGLNNPLSTIKCHIETLVMADTGNVVLTDEKRLDMFEDILQAANMIRDFSTGELLLTDVNIKPLIEDAIAYQADTATIDKVDLTASIDQHIPPILADEIRLGQVINALLYRSLQDTPRSYVRISATAVMEQGQEQLQILIEDDGNGLSEEKRKKMFNVPEYDASAPIPRQSHLSDMPLETIMELVELHHGQLNIDTALGQGTVMTLSIPYRHKEDVYQKPKTLAESPEKQGNVTFIRDFVRD